MKSRRWRTDRGPRHRRDARESKAPPRTPAADKHMQQPSNCSPRQPFGHGESGQQPSGPAGVRFERDFNRGYFRAANTQQPSGKRHGADWQQHTMPIGAGITGGGATGVTDDVTVAPRPLGSVVTTSSPSRSSFTSLKKPILCRPARSCPVTELTNSSGCTCARPRKGAESGRGLRASNA